MAINKVVYGDQTLVDLTQDSVEANNLLEGETAHDRSGNPVTGTAKQGHIVQNSSGTDMTQRPKMQFADSHVSDDEVNGRTVVENIKEVDPADYASTTDEGIIVTDDGDDALIGAVSDDKVEVTADGVKNIRQLLDELFARCDTSKISRDSVIVKANAVYAFQRPFVSGYMFVTSYGNTSSSELDTIIFKSSNSQYLENSYTTSGNTITEKSTTQVLSNGTKVTLYYGNKKATVDLQTTANRCLMSDGTSLQIKTKTLTNPTCASNGAIETGLSSDKIIVSVFADIQVAHVYLGGVYDGKYYLQSANFSTGSINKSTTLSGNVTIQYFG